MNLPNAVFLVMCNCLCVFVWTAKSNINVPSNCFPFSFFYIFDNHSLSLSFGIYIYMGVLWGKRWCFRFLFNFLLQIWLNLKWHGKILIEIMSSFCWRLVNNDKKKHQWSVELALQWCLSFQFRLLHSLFSFYFKFWKSFFLSCPPLILQW